MHFRESFFGTNKKEPRELDSIWSIFLGAMDDFTLKVLLVAAIASISIFIYKSYRNHNWS